MLTEPSVEELAALLRRVPTPPVYEIASGATPAELDELEIRAGVVLPAQLRRWLEEINGAMAGPGGLFGCRPPEDFLSILNVLKIFPEWRSAGWVPIASDGVGNYWVTAPAPDGTDGWVAFIDVHADPERLDHYVASTVLRFLKFLLESELGERRWPAQRDYVLSVDPGLAAVPQSQAPWGR